MSGRANLGIGNDCCANEGRANEGRPADEMFANRHGHVTSPRLELISRAEGLRPHPGWGCAL
jgi:hypothetical protein